MSGLAVVWARVRKSQLCGPVVTLLGGAWLLLHLMTSDYYAFSGNGAGYGPLSWPEFSLLMLISVAALLCATRARNCLRRSRGQEVPEVGARQECNNYRVAVGSWLILLYGLGVVFAGFLLSSVIFLIAWLLFGGMRNPLKLATISILGTLAPMYLLVKVAYMPLPRGVGVFETATVWLYELVGLF